MLSEKLGYILKKYVSVSVTLFKVDLIYIGLLACLKNYYYAVFYFGGSAVSVMALIMSVGMD